MKYVIAGSLGNISKPVSQKLIAAGHDVTIITSSQDKVQAIEALGATAAVGSVEDVAFLKQTFKGADVAYTMVPPKWDAEHWKEWIGSIGKNYAAAIKDSGIKFVVNLSSVGGHMPDGCGPVSGLYKVEQALNALQDVAVKHLRPAYFYHNLLAQVGLIKHAGIMGANFGDSVFPIVHPADIAEAAAEELLGLSFTGHSVRYVASDEVTGNRIVSVLGASIGKQDLPWVVFTDEANLNGMLQAGLSEEVAKNYTEMGTAVHTGAMHADYLKNKPTLSKTKLTDFAIEFAAVYNA